MSDFPTMERYGPLWLEMTERYWSWLKNEQRRINGVVIHRINCAVITRGCQAYLVFENNHAGAVNERLLRLNGWRLDHGRWICPAHES